MLPFSATPSLRTSSLAAALAFSLALGPAAPSYAWGEGEQNFVAGVATTLLLTQMFKGGGKKKAAPVPTYTPVYAPSVSVYNTPAAATFNAYGDTEQRRIQSTLSAYGYYSGPIDGVFGPGTYNATIAYANATKRSSLTTTMAGCATLYEDLLF